MYTVVPGIVFENLTNYGENSKEDKNCELLIPFAVFKQTLPFIQIDAIPSKHYYQMKFCIKTNVLIVKLTEKLEIGIKPKIKSLVNCIQLS